MNALWRRFKAVRSPLLESPAYRALFVLVVVGVLLIVLVPESVLILPTLDAIGLDVATLFVAFELRHYLKHAWRFVGMPFLRSISLLVPASPALRAYAVAWFSIGIAALRVVMTTWPRSRG